MSHTVARDGLRGRGERRRQDKVRSEIAIANLDTDLADQIDSKGVRKDTLKKIRKARKAKISSSK